MREMMVCAPRGALVVGSLLWLVACGDDFPDQPGGGGAGGFGGAGGAVVGGAGGAGGAGGTAPTEIMTATGSLTIQVVDPAVTCDGTTSIDAVEDRSTPWQCAACDVTLRSPITITAGDDCFGAETQLLGWSSDGTAHFRGGYGLTLPLGTAVQDGDEVTLTLDWTSTNPDLTITGSGNLTLGTAEGDPLQGWVASDSYSCGWPKADPPPFEGSYDASAPNSPLPDGVFTDQCGDKVRLHDLLGDYLVIHANQTTVGPCPPCDLAWADQAAFEADMAAANIPTTVVNLLVVGFDNPSPADPTDMMTWADAVGTDGPALADRGFADAIIGGDPLSFGYPAFMVVAPDGTILWREVGYEPSAPTTWDTIQSTIESHAGM